MSKLHDICRLFSLKRIQIRKLCARFGACDDFFSQNGQKKRGCFEQNASLKCENMRRIFEYEIHKEIFKKVLTIKRKCGIMLK
jgi:hypothetical protein